MSFAYETGRSPKMDIDYLPLINRNETTNKIFRLFAKSNPLSNQTNLESFKSHLIKNLNFYIDSNDFYKLFQDLEDLGLGHFSDHDRFIWKYSLKDISEQVLNPNKKVELRPINEQGVAIVERVEEEEHKETSMVESNKRRGRPKGSKNRKESPTYKEPVSSTQSPPRHSNGSTNPIFAFTTSRGNLVLLDIEDAEQIAKQLKQLKSMRL